MLPINKNLAGILITGLLIVSSAEEIPKWNDYWEKPAEITAAQVSEIKMPGLLRSSALVWIRMYQKGISSQDLPSCIFHPSCSRFAFGAIENFGPARGILLAGDRLLRCNPFAGGYYPFDGEKFSDPIWRYDLKKKK